LIALSVVGALAAVAVGIVLLIFRRRGRSPATSETVGQAIGVAFVGVGGERLYDRAPVALAAAVTIVMVVLMLAWRRHRRAS